MEGEKKYIITKTGERLQVIGETGRYFIMRDRQYRKSNPMIARIEIQKPKKKKKPQEDELNQERSVEQDADR